MGEARRRGTFDERRAAAKEQARANALWNELQHAIRNDVMWRVVFGKAIGAPPGQPYETHDGETEVRGIKLHCHKLSNGKITVDGADMRRFCEANGVQPKESA